MPRVVCGHLGPLSTRGPTPGDEMTQRRWTWDDVATMRALVAGGMKLADVARQYGKSRSRISQLLRTSEHRYGPSFDGHEISTRLKNCLQNADCWTVKDASRHSLAWWLEQPNFDKVCALELAELLDHRLLHSDLGTLAQCLRARNAELKRRHGRRSNAAGHR